MTTFGLFLKEMLGECEPVNTNSWGSVTSLIGQEVLDARLCGVMDVIRMQVL